MEFPELGKHCHNAECKQLDFLPMKCDGCAQIFCKDHFSYDSHHCPEAHRKNVQVPVCPLCNEPVAFKRGELPDIRVSEHIDRDCKSDPATVKRQKIYTNRCNKKGCKTKELVKITCDNCRLTYCLKHRHESDHECEGRSQGAHKSTPAANRAGAAAMQRSQSSQNSQQMNSGQAKIPQFFSSNSTNTSSANSAHATPPRATPPRATPPRATQPPFRPAAATGNLQPRDLTEDEALARAMSLSLQDSAPPTSSSSARATAEENGSALSEDEMLARAIAASEEEERRRRERNSNQNSNQTTSARDSRSNCAIS